MYFGWNAPAVGWSVFKGQQVLMIDAKILPQVRENVDAQYNTIYNSNHAIVSYL